MIGSEMRMSNGHRDSLVAGQLHDPQVNVRHHGSGNECVARLLVQSCGVAQSLYANYRLDFEDLKVFG
jgi:hypothetical protein